MPNELLEAVELHKSFGEVHAVDGITLTIDEGEFVAIIGRSGSGKSTLLNLIAGLDRPDSGALRFRGGALHDKDEDALAIWRGEHIGMVFQAFHLLPTLDATDNAAVPLLPRQKLHECRRRARHRLEQVGLGERLRHRPAQLSGGEQQRVAIARALVGNPALVLADEPTGNLDAATGSEILRLFGQLREQTNTAMVIVTHDDDVAAAADRRVHVLDGRLVS